MNHDFGDRVYQYLLARHVRVGALIGPDPGVRFNYRIWRFLKSETPFIAWKDDRYYLQAQGYWVLANWLLHRQPGDSFEAQARNCCDRIVERQRADGAWDQPNPEWRGRVTTVEGVWASLALLATYQRTQNQVYLDAVMHWHDFFNAKIGYQYRGDCTVVNYFANEVAKLVPNNSALTLRYLAALFKATSDRDYLAPCAGLLKFVQTSQKNSGEVPYIVGDPKMEHFQCFQYHAFMLIDILEYYRATLDPTSVSVLVGMARFLCNGLSPSGDAYYQCGAQYRTVNYHSAAVAAALSLMAELSSSVEWSDLSSLPLQSLSTRAFANLAMRQRTDGSVPHSRGDYRFLRDQRSYPRYLSMMLYHWTRCVPANGVALFPSVPQSTYST